MLTPTDEQLAIINSWKNSKSSSIMVSAYAGCAKTTTLELLSKEIRVPALALAFNKKIKDELASRFPPNFQVQTMNSLGFQALRRALPAVSKWEIDDRKIGKLVTQALAEQGVETSEEQWTAVRQLVGAVMNAGVVPTEISATGGLLPDELEVWRSIADDLFIGKEDFNLLAPAARQTLIDSIKLVPKGIISFDDQIYYPALISGKFIPYPVVLVDEAQDLSPLNRELVRKSIGPTSRLVVAGDQHQCHPEGTMIHLSHGRKKPIEDIQIGNQLVSYNRKQGFVGLTTQGTRVIDKQEFHFKGNLVKIKTENGFEQSCTPNHRCLVKWVDKDGYSVYMMRKGNHYRIGSAQNWYNSAGKGGFGPAMRARQEKADELWILDSFPTKDQALINEKVIWTLFGLPDLIFKQSGKLSSTQAHLDAAWEMIGDNSARAKECLKQYGREFDYPIWTKDSNVHIGEKRFITQACNIVQGTMAVCTMAAEVKEEWSIVWPERVPFDGKVIGLTVQSNGYGQNLYVADSIVTHNSIYAFRGADSLSMQRLRSLRSEWVDLPLTLTWRCPKAIVARQQAHAPGFRAAAGAPEGLFARLEVPSEIEGEAFWSWADLERRSRPGDRIAILCRNNAPILKLAFKLLRQQIGVSLLGRDLAGGLLAQAKRLFKSDTPASEIRKILDDYFISETSKLGEGDEAKIDSISDRVESIRAILDGSNARDGAQLQAAIKNIFSRENGRVELGSIHRAKGLEWDVVVHLDPWRIPSRSARDAAKRGNDVPLEQERNLKYVCETRTKFALLEANVEEFI